MVFSLELLVLFALSMLLSAVGFKKYVYFFSIGYGFAIAGLGAFMFARYPFSLGTALCCLILIAYGLRLGLYLLVREMKSKAYSAMMNGEIKDGLHMPMVAKCSIWVACALLYILQVSPIFYRLQNGAAQNIWVFIGAALMLVGFLMEVAADMQKQAAKKKNPRRFCDTGLYRFVRCPNYLGELILWAGALVTGVGVLSLGQWIVVILGFVGITYVMFSGARRLELRQNRTYGDDPEYQQYIMTVPILLPFVPLYSVVKYKFLVA